MEECQKGSINNRINILYFLDSLCESSLLAKSLVSSSSRHHPNGSPSYYVSFVSRDLAKVVGYVVPEGRAGLPNLMSTKQMLNDWRVKRVVDPQTVDDALAMLESRQAPPDSPPAALPSPLADATISRHPQLSSTFEEPLPRHEIMKRIEEDRERHKRLRERRWVQPVLRSQNAGQLASFLPLSDDQDGASELPIDIEFENEWETTSDWNEDDDDAVAEENELCFPGEGETPMDLS